MTDGGLRARLGTRANGSPLDSSSWILSVAILAVVIPASDKVASNDVFFAAHGVSPIAWVVLLIAGLVLTWLVLAGILRLLKSTLSATAFDVVTTIVMLVITWFFVGNVLSRTVFASTPILGPIVGFVLAAVITLVARRVRMGLVLFVFASVAAAIPLVSNVLSDAQTPPSEPFAFDAATSRPNIVWVISDELQYPLAFTKDGQARPELPNLAALQKQSTTYTRAYSAANYTDYAVPSQLTGISDAASQGNDRMEKVRAGLGIIPGLSNEYSVVTESPIYHFECNDANCASVGSDASQSVFSRYLGFAADTAAIAGKTALAEPFSNLFPSLDGKWKDFWSGGDEFGNDADADSVSKAISGIQQARSAYPDAPVFALWHTIRTHAPWAVDRQGLPIYPARLPVVEGAHMVGSDKAGKYSTPQLQSLERRLYAASAIDFDRQLGELVAELKAEGTFDDTMIVVTADHGATIPITQDRRYGDTLSERWSQVAHVPLMIKGPGQQTPEVVTAVRSTGQIAQTVMESAGATPGSDLTLSPDLSQDLASPPVFSTVAGGVMTPWVYSGVKEVDPWTADDLTPVNPDYPFAIGIDPSLLGAAAPSGYAAAPDITIAPLPGESDQQLLVLTRDPATCTGDVGLVTSGDTVIGSALWERTTASGSVDTRGWAIVPKSDPTTYRVLCPTS